MDLWAKSANRSGGGSPLTIFEHSWEVLKAAEAVWCAVGAQIADGLGEEREDLDRWLLPLLRAVALLHDVGKANSAFQAMLRAKRGTGHKQPLRHEILGAILLSRQLLVCGLALEDQWPLVWAVGGHHLQIPVPGDGDPLFQTQGSAPRLDVYLSHPQVADLTGQAIEVLTEGGRKCAPPTRRADLTFDVCDDGEESLEGWCERFVNESNKAWNRLRSDAVLRRRLAVLKALVIAADVAGSALPAGGEPVADWVESALQVRVNAQALDPVIAAGLKGDTPRTFQKRVRDSDHPATVVVAGCGNGKTTAAYMWAQRWARGRKLFFTYPTTGTASAGFADYLLEQREVASALIHGRSLVDLQAMLGTPEDSVLDEWLRYESLQAWNRQVIICTVDTVLGLIQNQRRPLFSFPAIGSGAFVFDEVHSYDRRLFGELLTFLGTFPKAPVLLMSASIPPGRMRRLREVLGSRMAEEATSGDSALEGHRRYRLRAASEDDCWEAAASTIRHPTANKVLWVCNTVGDASRAYREARQRFPRIEPLLYHSRFRYRDRVKRQTTLRRRFEEPEPLLAITTQVCEMSLDISANLLLTAECPLSSLVQRLGRLNRKAKADDPWPCLVYPFQGDPYNEEESCLHRKGDYRAAMSATRAAVAELAGQPCSQAMLSRYLDRLNDAEDVDTSSVWLNGGWQTYPLPAREGDQSITVIREEDLDEVVQELGPESSKRWTQKRLVPWTIPMLYDRLFTSDRRAGGYPVVPKGTVHYDEEGASWRRS
jgi:CRISPR-associated endonuclease/helicase Cas3